MIALFGCKEGEVISGGENLYLSAKVTAAGPRKKQLIGWKPFCKLGNSFQTIQLTPDNWTSMTNYPKAFPKRKELSGKWQSSVFKLETFVELHNQPL